MAVPIRSLDMEGGDSLFLKLYGSTEMSLLVNVHDGRLFVRGPFNANSKVLEVTPTGMEAVDPEVTGMV